MIELEILEKLSTQLAEFGKANAPKILAYAHGAY